MQDRIGLIERVTRVADNLQRLTVAVESPQSETGLTIAPGQYFLVRINDSWMPYLRDPWLPTQVNGNSVTFDRPLNADFQPGQVLHLFGPLGQPIPLREGVRTLLLIAYDAVPTPLLYLANQALRRKVSVTLALIGTARGYNRIALPSEIELLTGDDHDGWPNQKASFGWADQIVALALPHELQRYARLLEAVTDARVELPGQYLFGIFQLPILCGVGACGVCQIMLHKQQIALTCSDGPAFDLLDVSFR